MKSLFSSKTFRLAIIQAIVGGLVIFLTEMDMVGYVVLIKSLGDVALRMATSEAVKI